MCLLTSSSSFGAFTVVSSPRDLSERSERRYSTVMSHCFTLSLFHNKIHLIDVKYWCCHAVPGDFKHRHVVQINAGRQSLAELQEQQTAVKHKENHMNFLSFLQTLHTCVNILCFIRTIALLHIALLVLNLNFTKPHFVFCY